MRFNNTCDSRFDRYGSGEKFSWETSDGDALRRFRRKKLLL